MFEVRKYWVRQEYYSFLSIVNGEVIPSTNWEAGYSVIADYYAYSNTIGCYKTKKEAILSAKKVGLSKFRELESREKNG